MTKTISPIEIETLYRLAYISDRFESVQTLQEYADCMLDAQSYMEESSQFITVHEFSKKIVQALAKNAVEASNRIVTYQEPVNIAGIEMHLERFLQPIKNSFKLDEKTQKKYKHFSELTSILNNNSKNYREWTKIRISQSGKKIAIGVFGNDLNTKTISTKFMANGRSYN